jgi:uroporphyrin-3 C-methyltransferase
LKKKDNTPDNINLSNKQVSTGANSGSSEKTKSEKKSSNEKNNASTSKISPIIKFIAKLLFLLLFLASVAAIIFGGSEIYSINQQQVEDRKASKKYQAHIDALYVEIKKDKEIFQEKNAELYALISNLKERVTDNSDRLGELSFPRERSILLAEAEYLIWLAETYIISKNSPKKIAEIFVSIDAILGKLKFLSANESRDIVVNIISVLGSASIVNRENIYSKLSLMTDQLGQLPFIQTIRDLKTNSKTTTYISESEQGQWQENFYTGIHTAFLRFKDLIRIKKHKYPPNLVPPQEKRQQLIQQLKVVFGQTQMSLLLQEEGVYKKSLTKAKKLLLKNYSDHDELIRTYIQQIDELEQQNIVQKIPDISLQLNTIKENISRLKKNISGDQK